MTYTTPGAPKVPAWGQLRRDGRLQVSPARSGLGRLARLELTRVPFASADIPVRNPDLFPNQASAGEPMSTGTKLILGAVALYLVSRLFK